MPLGGPLQPIGILVVTTLQLRAEYRQIRILDEDSETDLVQYWTDEAVNKKLAVAHDAIALATEQNGIVTVAVESCDHRSDAESTRVNVQLKQASTLEASDWQ